MSVAAIISRVKVTGGGDLSVFDTPFLEKSIARRMVATGTATPGEYPNLKVLLMSGYTANAIVHHGVLEQGIHFLQKPFTRRDLVVKVREAIGK